ncbi:MAG: hypothetical protein HYS87_02780 [Candidatus Colwellbacteria bacterium]|nr:hypothetical protein [Candidatus Colwellbacteria bacterium]
MKTKAVSIALAVIATALLAGCADEQSGPVKANTMNIIAGGVGQDIPARVYQEYGMDTSCSPDNSAYSGEDRATAILPCPDNNGYPHVGGVCSNMKWSVQFRNDHGTGSGDEAKYGLPYDSKLINSLQQWRAEKLELRFYWIRYSDTECKYTDNEVVYCVELTSLSLANSMDHGCIKAMKRTFPGLNTAWDQGYNFANPSGVADASNMAEVKG